MSGQASSWAASSIILESSISTCGNADDSSKAGFSSNSLWPYQLIMFRLCSVI
jgi:hypothetical protein